MINYDSATGATTADTANSNYLNRLTPNMFLTILAIVVIVALLIIFIQSSSNGNNSSSPNQTPNPNLAFTNPLNATMRANPFINTPQRQMM
ncbi:ODV-E18 [Lonomia obliqua multiple nucleopolyhedrovirus]|uniref:ODV-E18 n=1 Tax=Lonomia obliqua multiple nucleopolyhedrovirus TaxID=134394 RepID=A0A126FC49_9ABAC|nr:ODV-E18 [Lonomia obliqua multiple nucleopolyhedrovirus]AKN80953.1 ODV-E18 [Lonomia obliqua multiple nucleopolyhedrovirus]